MLKVVEMLVFVPYTKESTLRKRLHEVDNMLGEATNTPACRIMKRCGEGTIMDLLSRANPRVMEW